jgi:hypothetical protein
VKGAKPNSKDAPEKVDIELPAGRTEGDMIAELRLNPILRHAAAANALAAQTVAFPERLVSAGVAADQLRAIAERVATGDLRHVSDSYLSQAVLLDSMVTELMRRAWLNVREYPAAFDRYMTMALKAQAQSRATLEALAKLHQPREQVVRHVHVYEGGQAVVAEEFHNHHPGVGNAGIAYQPLDPRSVISPLPGANAGRDAVPVPGRSREEAVLPARRSERKRRPAGQQERPQARPEVGGDDSASTVAPKSRVSKTRPRGSVRA